MSLWTPEQTAHLHELYKASHPVSTIADQLQKTIEQINNKIAYEARIGRMQRDGRKARWVKRYSYAIDGRQPVDAYEENGLTVKVYAMGYAIGINPSPSAM